MGYNKENQQDDSIGGKKLPLLCAKKELWICVAYPCLGDPGCGGEGTLVKDLFGENGAVGLDLLIPAPVTDFWRDPRR
jgi:hypothetical protein